jgi:hypothetical protein
MRDEGVVSSSRKAAGEKSECSLKDGFDRSNSEVIRANALSLSEQTSPSVYHDGQAVIRSQGCMTSGFDKSLGSRGLA